MVKYLFISLALLLSFPAVSQEKRTPGNGRPGKGILTIEVTDSLGKALPYVSLGMKVESGDMFTAGMTDGDGKAEFSLIPGRYTIVAAYMGYQPAYRTASVWTGEETRLSVTLRENRETIQEVTVTATESEGITSSSNIGRHAMEHLQPSSFSDILALLPGGRSTSPSLGVANTIHIREIGVESDDYSTSSLGTSFVIDGAPVRNDANMQQIPGSPAYDPVISRKYFVNKGVDMRSISTDEIEHIEIVRGIPSVEYGDLTSGLVRIERKRGGNDLNARFKADMSSKLFYVGKGIEHTASGLAINIGADFLDAKSDPRDKLENYKRLTGSVRIHKTWDSNPGHSISLGANLDYTGSFDNTKEDPELNNGNPDEFKSSYNRASASLDFDLLSKEDGFFRQLEANLSGDISIDRIRRNRYVSRDRTSSAPASMDAGEHDGVYIPGSYIAGMTVDGKPVSAYAKVVARFQAEPGHSTHRLNAGADWSFDKNYGRGQVLDITRPLFSGNAQRPWPYNAIPAQHDLGIFIEDNSTFRLGRSSLEIMAGLRAMTMLNIGREYNMHGRIWLDPRVNMKFSFPNIEIWDIPIRSSIGGGIGQHTKTPTMGQLYPSPVYFDLTQLNYYNNDHPELRRVNYMTYIVNPANFSLSPARNLKWEIRGDLSVGGNRLSITYFQENMKSGFRNSDRYDGFERKVYDITGVDGNSLQEPPQLEDLPFTRDTLMYGWSVTTNSSRTFKKGVELSFSSKRIEAIRTRLTVTGAWFWTEYSNSEPVYYYSGTIINGKRVMYTGIYLNDSNYLREIYNTNFTFDTDIPRLGLGFSVTLQCVWYNRQRNTPRSRIPDAYCGTDGVIHPYTEESAQDPYLKTLINNYNEDAFRWTSEPFYMTSNIKVTKKLFEDKITVAMFINQLINYMPDYDSYGVTVRRSATPYFGMELNFKL